MQVSLQTLLARPKGAFERATRPLGLTQPLTVVFLVQILALTTLLPLYVEFGRQIPRDTPTITMVAGGQTAGIPVVFALSLLVGSVIGLLTWLVFTGLLHLGARLAGSDATAGQTLVVSAWAQFPVVPILAAAIAIAFGTAMVDPEATVRTVLHGRTEPGGGALPTYDGKGLMDARSVVGYGQVLWIGYVQFGGLRAVHALSKRRAGAVVGTIAVLELLVLQVSL